MNILVLVNPRSGNNQGERWLTALRARLQRPEQGLRSVVLPTRLDAIRQQLLEKAQGMDRIIVVGGDGTVGAVVNALTALPFHIPVGIVPLGTGNDLARSLGLHWGRPWTLEEALVYLRSSSMTPVDVWSLNGQLTFNNYLSVGLDAQVVRGFSRIRQWIQVHPTWGKRGVYFAVYIMVWLRNLKGRVPEGSQLIWVDPMGSKLACQLNAPRVLAVTNTPYYAAGALIDPNAAVGDGLVEVTLFPHMRAYTELMAMRVPALARRGIQERWWRIRARRLEIHLSEPSSFQIDGEDITEHTKRTRVMSIERRGQIAVLIGDWPAR